MMKEEQLIDQEVLLDETQTRASQNAGLMKKSLESGNLREALKYADLMLAELRSPHIQPKYYYILCNSIAIICIVMGIFNDLKELEDQFLEEKKKGRRMADLYESVQQAPEILSRLYLMVTVGAAFIETKEATSKEILKDLHEMAKGLQNPLRGLFLRYFMLKKLKDKFPDKNSKFEGYLI